ncbi:hypothetical protein NK8_63200 (plasmid) [Caballeronia sp. NK8]|uniref:hypothetical protein n=1 Tax=Caballeronia sp. NK8 TaxID=140098 RepID=UPI001BB4EDED|nr:hypothetical protein [Caballeronia sp. NK8]BCQ28131.1 hypothetical protein NK8_63200 [Caballeronia sp. NK8]
MFNIPYMEWDETRLSDDSRAWFIATYPGKVVGIPTASWLFVCEIPHPRCLCLHIFDAPASGWVHRAICEIAATNTPPDLLVTDETRLQHALVSVGSSFTKPAKAYIDKSLMGMPEIPAFLRCLEEVLNDPLFQKQSIGEKNATFDSWRTKYNLR